MRYVLYSILINLFISASLFSAIVDGVLITQIRGITNQVNIRSSSNPAVEQQPGENGAYEIDIASQDQDYILIAPQDRSSTLYSPRIIRASQVSTDTLYIIPPTNPSLSIIVDNKTNREFSFLIDRCIILNKLTTSENDYELTVIPHHSGMQNVLIAGIASGYPAVVKSVAINPAQRRGILTIEPQDIGIEQAPTPPPVVQTEPFTPEPVYEPTPQPESNLEERLAQLEAAQNQEEVPPQIVYKEVKPQKVEEKPAPPPTVIRNQSQKEIDAAKKQKAERIEAAQSAFYFSDRLVVKDRRNTSIAIQGAYYMYPQMTPTPQLYHYGVDLYNLRLFKKYFDINAQTATSDVLEGSYYRGSLTWHHSPYASIDLAYKSAQNEIWNSQYDVAQTSVGVNGYYKSQGVNFQLGAGVRFQVDIGDYKDYFPDQVENRYRYLQSLYIIGNGRFGSSSGTLLLGMINEAFYASATLFIGRFAGVNYTFKNLNTENDYFTPYETEMLHRVSVYLNFTLKNREKLLLQ